MTTAAENKEVRQAYSILVIDDDRVCSGIIRAVFQDSSTRTFYPYEADTIEDGIREIENRPIDAIILDLNLIQSGGIDTLKVFLERFGHIPVVVYTGNDNDQLALEAIRMGAQEYVVKGSSKPGALVHHVLQAIERKKLEQLALKTVNRNLDRAQTRLVEVEDQFKSIVEQLPAITYILDAADDFKPAYISPQVEPILGYSVEEWFDDPGLQRKLLHPDDLDWVSKTSEHCYNSGQDLDLVYRMISKNKETVWFKDHAHAQRGADGSIRYIHGVRLDITRRKNAEDALKKRDQQLQQSQKMHAVGRLAGGIAHEFNNLLTSILGFSYLLVDEVDAEHPHHEYAEQIIQSGERASDLIRQMLAFSNKQTNKVEVFDLNKLVTNLEKFARKSIDPNVELVVSPRAEKNSIKGDKTQIEQILMGLVSNSEDAMESNGTIEISTYDAMVSEEEADIRKCAPGSYVCLSVKDTGGGIDPKIIDKIYDPFFSTKEVGQGVGLGLSIIYTYVEQHRGHIDIDSVPGEGTDFKIFFPLVDASAPESHDDAIELPRGTETILLVEDEHSVRTITQRSLENLGYNVLPAENGGEAILITETYKKPIHLLLTDFAMPKLNGNRLVDRLQQDHSEFKVLYTSGYDRKTVASQNEGVFETNFIQKPYKKETLAYMVRQVLDEQKKDKSDGFPVR